jgi:tyrosinase
MTTVRYRRNIASLTSAEKQRFRNAVFRMREQGRYQRYVNFHGFVSNLGHFGPAFLPWHRVFLATFEEELRSIDPGVTLPYWDFTQTNFDSAAGQSLIWNNDLFGGPGTVTLNWTGADGTPQSWTIRRANFNPQDDPVTVASVDGALNETTYQGAGGSLGFRARVENGHHGGAHNWLGTPGDQQSFTTAVNDPFFLLLHANIDRIWTRWQERRRRAWIAANPGLPYPAGQRAADYFYDGLTPATTWTTPPNRHNLNNAMWPWDGTRADPGDPNSAFSPWKDGMPVTYTPRMTLRSSDFGYVYDTDEPDVELLVTAALARYPDGRQLDIWATGNDGQVYTAFYNDAGGSWNGWFPIVGAVPRLA